MRAMPGPSIEEKLVQDLGTTDDIALAVWMLKDGTLVNGSREGRQRDLDHRHIGDYASEYLGGLEDEAAMRRFMRRGNVRLGFSEAGPCFEFLVPLTEAQLRMLVPWARWCAHNSREFCAVRHAKGRKICEGAWRFLFYVSKYMKRNVFDYPETPECLER